ncbi:MAG: PQQ-binding-like beta-propeller repeat protein [Pyrinomonadaceae bacterium]
MTRNILLNARPAKLAFFLISIFGSVGHPAFAQLLSVDAVKLKKCRQYDFADTAIIAAASDNSNFYVATEDGSVHAIDPVTSRKLWTSNFGGRITSNLIVAGGRIFVAGNAVPVSKEKPETSVLRSLNPETGLVIWNSPILYSEQIYLGSGGKSIISVGREGSVTSKDGTTGGLLWRASFAGNLTTVPDINYERIVAGTGQKEIISIDGRTGATVMRSKTKFIPSAVLNYTAKAIAAGDERGNLILIDSAAGKTIWKYKSGGKISFIAQTDEGVLAASNDNFIYMLWDYNGDVLWKKRLPGRIAGPPLIGGDTVSVQLSADRSTFVLNLENGKIVNQFLLVENSSSGIMPGFFNNNLFVFSTPVSVVSYGIKPCPVE